MNFFEFGPADDVILRHFYFQLWLPFCKAEQNRLVNFGGGPYGEHLGEIILKFL